MATVLTLHRGGADPAELARLEDEAEEAMRAYADALPASDQHHGAFDAVAMMLKLRRSRREFEATMVVTRRGRPDAS